VIHAVGPVYASYTPDEAGRLLASAVRSALELASREGLETISLPAISSGIFGFPKDRCAEVMIDAVTEFFAEDSESSLREINLCNFDEPTVAVFAAALKSR
jgi:O-acetyl-ADP-ribose deacetylase (regulator of RNase III)